MTEKTNKIKSKNHRTHSNISENASNGKQNIESYQTESSPRNRFHSFRTSSICSASSVSSSSATPSQSFSPLKHFRQISHSRFNSQSSSSSHRSPRSDSPREPEKYSIALIGARRVGKTSLASVLNNFGFESFSTPPESKDGVSPRSLPHTHHPSSSLSLSPPTAVSSSLSESILKNCCSLSESIKGEGFHRYMKVDQIPCIVELVDMDPIITSSTLDQDLSLSSLSFGSMMLEHTLQEVDGFAMIYSVDDIHSLEQLKDLYSFILRLRDLDDDDDEVKDTIPMVMIGNKRDVDDVEPKLEENEDSLRKKARNEIKNSENQELSENQMFSRRQISISKAKQFAASHCHRMPVMETSTKKPKNAEFTIQSLVREIRRISLYQDHDENEKMRNESKTSDHSRKNSTISNDSIIVDMENEQYQRKKKLIQKYKSKNCAIM